MKALVFTITLFIACSAYSQSNIYKDHNPFKDVVYFDFNKESKKAEYFGNRIIKDGRKDITNTTQLTLIADNECNIFINWLNPIKYRIHWTNEAIADERDVAIREFVNSLVGQFGNPLSRQTDMTIEEEVSGLRDVDSTDGSAKFIIELFSEVQVGDYVRIFNDPNLNHLLFYLSQNEDDVDAGLKKLIPTIYKLDTLLSNGDAAKIEGFFVRLMEIESEENVLDSIASIRKGQEMISVNVTQINTLKDELTIRLKDLSIANKPFVEAYIKKVIGDFITKAGAQSTSINQLINKLEPLFNLLTNSIDVSKKSYNQSGYFRTNEVNFEDDQKMRSTILIEQFRYDAGNKTFIKNAEVLKKTVVFRRYDPIDVFISTGIFYANVNLKSYGVSNNSSDEFVVEETEINSSHPVTAVFLNLTFPPNSRFFKPLIQLGIDPSKQNPFMLAGIGFSIPTARFAITGGPVWTWESTLQKLDVGDLITSTLDLEKDLKKEFRVDPQGFYLGLQYNF